MNWLLMSWLFVQLVLISFHCWIFFVWSTWNPSFVPEPLLTPTIAQDRTIDLMSRYWESWVNLGANEHPMMKWAKREGATHISYRNFVKSYKGWLHTSFEENIRQGFLLLNNFPYSIHNSFEWALEEVGFQTLKPETRWLPFVNSALLSLTLI